MPWSFGKPNIDGMYKKKDIRGLLRALKNSDKDVRWGAARYLKRLFETAKPAYAIDLEPLVAALHDQE
jgi:HEAT repeat protein